MIITTRSSNFRLLIFLDELGFFFGPRILGFCPFVFKMLSKLLKIDTEKTCEKYDFQRATATVFWVFFTCFVVVV
jgi:hypothetical protein